VHEKRTGLGPLLHTNDWPASWGGTWTFSVASIEAGNITFADGGHQEARGGSRGNSLYVEAVLSELDTAGEYFHDVEEQKLHWIPNGTATDKAELIVPVLKRLLEVKGSPGAGNYAQHLAFEGLRFTHAAPTNMDDYLVPSAGDWSIHRGAAVFLQDAEHVRIRNCTFAELGGNALFLSNHVQHSTGT